MGRDTEGLGFSPFPLRQLIAKNFDYPDEVKESFKIMLLDSLAGSAKNPNDPTMKNTEINLKGLYSIGIILSFLNGYIYIYKSTSIVERQMMNSIEEGLLFRGF